MKVKTREDTMVEVDMSKSAFEKLGTTFRFGDTFIHHDNYTGKIIGVGPNKDGLLGLWAVLEGDIDKASYFAPYELHNLFPF